MVPATLFFTGTREMHIAGVAEALTVYIIYISLTHMFIYLDDGCLSGIVCFQGPSKRKASGFIKCKSAASCCAQRCVFTWNKMCAWPYLCEWYNFYIVFVNNSGCLVISFKCLEIKSRSVVRSIGVVKTVDWGSRGCWFKFLGLGSRLLPLLVSLGVVVLFVSLLNV